MSSRPKPVSYEEASPEAQAVIDDIKRSRNVPDVNDFWKYLARDPKTLKRTWESIKEVMAPGALDPLTKELVYLAVSVTNNGTYCIASHTAAARKAGMSEAMFAELVAVIGMANETNRLVTAYRVPVDPASTERRHGERHPGPPRRDRHPDPVEPVDQAWPAPELSLRPAPAGRQQRTLRPGLRFVPARDDKAVPASYGWPGALPAAIDAAPPGSIVVIDARGHPAAGTVGDIFADRLRLNRVQAIVSDGVVRDLPGLRQVGLPVWASGTASPPSIGGLSFAGWSEPIGCGDTAIWPGDLIVADEDGVLVVPP